MHTSIADAMFSKLMYASWVAHLNLWAATSATIEVCEALLFCGGHPHVDIVFLPVATERGSLIGHRIVTGNSIVGEILVVLSVKC